MEEEELYIAIGSILRLGSLVISDSRYVPARPFFEISLPELSNRTNSYYTTLAIRVPLT